MVTAIITHYLAACFGFCFHKYYTGRKTNENR